MLMLVMNKATKEIHPENTVEAKVTVSAFRATPLESLLVRSTAYVKERNRGEGENMCTDVDVCACIFSRYAGHHTQLFAHLQILFSCVSKPTNVSFIFKRPRDTKPWFVQHV